MRAETRQPGSWTGDALLIASGADLEVATGRLSEGRRARRARIESTILAATHTLLEDRSASEVTISDLMERVGLSRTAFYRYFPDVNSVLIRLLHEVQSEFIGTWLESPHDADFQQVLRGDSLGNVERFRIHRSIIQACLDARTSAPELHTAWVDVVDRVVERAGLRISDLNRAGVTDVTYPMEMARALMTFTVHYVMESLQRIDREQLSMVAETMGDVWYRTIFCKG
jgi:AcrR family transcriptional regulator